MLATLAGVQRRVQAINQREARHAEGAAPSDADAAGSAGAPDSQSLELVADAEELLHEVRLQTCTAASLSASRQSERQLGSEL